MTQLALELGVALDADITAHSDDTTADSVEADVMSDVTGWMYYLPTNHGSMWWKFAKDEPKEAGAVMLAKFTPDDDAMRPFEKNQALRNAYKGMEVQKEADDDTKGLGGWKTFLKTVALRKGTDFTLLEGGKKKVKLAFLSANEDSITMVEVDKSYDLNNYKAGVAMLAAKQDDQISKALPASGMKLVNLKAAVKAYKLAPSEAVWEFGKTTF
jgi:hypothetical protein